jgi:hypothetical protein
MLDDKILKDNAERKIAETLYEVITDEERKELDTLKSIDIELE